MLSLLMELPMGTGGYLLDNSLFDGLQGLLRMHVFAAQGFLVFKKEQNTPCGEKKNMQEYMILI